MFIKSPGFQAQVASLKVKKAQFLYLHDSVWCNPNGDPMTGEPRMDFAEDKVLTSDVKYKRAIRNLLSLGGYDIYVEGVDRGKLAANFKGSGSAARISILQEKFGVKTAEEAMLKCRDAITFGSVSTDKGNTASITGPIQIAVLNPSLNRVELRPHQNTSVLQSDMEKEQGAIGTTSLVPFSLNQIHGMIDPFGALNTGLTEEDVMIIMDVLWLSINNTITRSKSSQTSRFLLKFNLSNPLGKIADLDRKIKISSKDPDMDEIALRSIDQVNWDFSELVKVIASDKVESVQYRVEDALLETFTNQMASVKSKLIEF